MKLTLNWKGVNVKWPNQPVMTGLTQVKRT